jgi:hypothetical protein
MRLTIYARTMTGFKQMSWMSLIQLPSIKTISRFRRALLGRIDVGCHNATYGPVRRG